jgi:radical SAM protein with 4Fe4S-binding SPASM domain
MRVNIVTNGTLLSNKLNILKSHICIKKVTISLHSFEANKVSQQLSDYLNSCFVCADVLAQSNKICELRLWNLNSTLKSGFNTLNVDILNAIGDHYQQKLDENILNIQKNITLCKNIFLGVDEIFDWPNENSKTNNKNGFCFGLRTHFGILVDGTVVPCCLDNNGTINLGNIFKTNIDEILNGERAKNIYENFSHRKICEKLCAHCGYIDRFNQKK